MLEKQSFLIARDLPNSCEQESEWVYNAHLLTELSDDKHPVEEGERNKLSGDTEGEDTEMDVDCLIPSQDQGNDQNHSGVMVDDSTLLIHQLGRDMSINCLVRCSRSDYGSIASLNRSFRSLIRTGELYRLRRQMGIEEHWVYFSCNIIDWEAFDPNRGRWMKLPKMNWTECFMCSDKESLGVGTELLVFGKEILAPVIHKYSVLTNTWSRGMEMNGPRCLFGSASLGGIAIIAGGSDLRGNILSTAELYNSDTGTWETLPNMNKARKLCSGVFMDGKFYVLGGLGPGHSNHLTCAEVFDLKTRKWSEIPNMFPAPNGGAGVSSTPVGAGAPPLVAVVNNVLYAADYEQQELRRYVKHNNSWVTLGRLPDGAASLNGWGLAFRACGDRLIVIGGTGAYHGREIEVSAWVPDEGAPQWNLLGRRYSGSFVYNCAVMGC